MDSEVKDRSRSTTILSCCCLIVIIIAVVLSLLGFTISKFVIGGLYFNDCELQPLLPIFLIVDASVSLLSFSTTKICSRRIKSAKSSEEEAKPLTGFQTFGAIFALGIFIFHFVWLIFGTIWTVNTREVIHSSGGCQNVSMVTSPTACLTCSEILTDFSFAVVIIQWIVVGLLIVAGIVGCCFYILTVIICDRK